MTTDNLKYDDIHEALKRPMCVPEDDVINNRFDGDLNKFYDCVISVASYTIAMAYYCANDMVQRMTNEMRTHPFCNRHGFKVEMNNLLVAMRCELSDLAILEGKEHFRVQSIGREIIPYYDDKLRNILLSTENWLAKYRVNERKLLAKMFLLQGMTDRMRAVAITSWIELGRAHIAKMDNINLASEVMSKFSQKTKLYSLNRTNEAAKNLSDKICQLTYGDSEVDYNINECESIKGWIDYIETQIRDLDLLELHTAYSLEQFRGKEYLKKWAPESYRMLHPKDVT